MLMSSFLTICLLPNNAYFAGKSPPCKNGRQSALFLLTDKSYIICGRFKHEVTSPTTAVRCNRGDEDDPSSLLTRLPCLRGTNDISEMHQDLANGPTIRV